MPSITPMMSAIFLLLVSMPCMVCTTLRTASPPSVTTRCASRVSLSADCACSALWATVEPSSSMAAAVSSSALASLSVRVARSILDWAISALAMATLCACSFTARTTRVSPVLVLFMASSRCPISSLRVLGMRTVRSPSAMASAMRLASFRGRTIMRRISQNQTAASTSTAIKPITANLMMRLRVSAMNSSVYALEDTTQFQGA